MPNYILRTEFGDPLHLMITEIDIDQYPVLKQVKASELAAAIEAEDGALTMNYHGYQGEWFYDVDNLASRTQAHNALLDNAIAWFCERGTDVARDDRLHLVQNTVTESRGKRMKTTRHDVKLGYTRDQLNALFAMANTEDVEQGGRYDARSGALNVWTHAWINPATRTESETMGTLYVNWIEDCIWQIECDESFDLDDLLFELGILERKALGSVKHGRT